MTTSPTKRFSYSVILGQVNFFMAFDIRFCRSESFFEITPWDISV